MKPSCIWFLINFVSIANASLSNTEPNSELVSTVVIFRHGDRSPIESYPNDPYFNCKYWPMGMGHLTKSGINRSYKLGQWFRQRYNTSLSAVYHPKEIYVWSTDCDRTLMTAVTVLAGLYPPKDYQLWNDQILWQPIPVHTVERKKDDIIVEKRTCPLFLKLLQRAKKLKYPAYAEAFSNLFKSVSEHTGWKQVTVSEIQILRNNLYSYSHYNISFIPEWIKSLDMIEIEYLSAVDFSITSYTTMLARLRIGPFFDYLFNYFDNFVLEKPTSVAKFLMMSSHDTILINIMDAMAAYDMRQIGFCDVIIFELRKSSDGGYFVNVLLKQQDELQPLRIYDCDFNCNYEDFKKKMSNITVDINTWEQECKNI